MLNFRGLLEIENQLDFKFPLQYLLIKHVEACLYK